MAGFAITFKVVGFWLDTLDEGLVVFKGTEVIAMPLAGCVTGLVIDGVFQTLKRARFWIDVLWLDELSVGVMAGLIMAVVLAMPLVGSIAGLEIGGVVTTLERPRFWIDVLWLDELGVGVLAGLIMTVVLATPLAGCVTGLEMEWDVFVIEVVGSSDGVWVGFEFGRSLLGCFIRSVEIKSNIG